MPNNHFMTVTDISKALNINPSVLYGWAKDEKVPTKKNPQGITLLSMDAVKEHRKTRLTKKHTVKAMKKKRRPATKQADKLAQLAAVLEVFFPEAIPVKQYVNALILVRALDAVTA